MLKYWILGILEVAVFELSACGFLALCIAMILAPLAIIELTATFLIYKINTRLDSKPRKHIWVLVEYMLKAIKFLLSTIKYTVKQPRRFCGFLLHLTAYVLQELTKWTIKLATMAIVEIYAGLRNLFFFCKENRVSKTANGDLLLLLLATLLTIYALLKVLPGFKLVILTLSFFGVILLSRSIIPRYRLDMVLKQTWRVWVFIYLIVIIFWFWTWS